MTRRTGLATAIGLIAVTTLVARVVGFGRWIVFSGTVGGTCVGEAYQTSNVVPNVLFEVAAGGALAAVVVPIVGRALASGHRAEADQSASALLTWAATILIPSAVLLAVLAGPVTAALLGRSELGCQVTQQGDLARTMLLVFAPQLPLYGVGIVLAGVLQAHRRFLAAALAPLLSSLVVIVSYLAYAQLASGAHGDPGQLSGAAVAALAGGTTLGVVALSVPLLLPIRRAGVQLRPTWTFPPGVGRRALHLAGSGIVALVAQQLAVVATLVVSNHHGRTGTYSVYTYVQAVYLLPYAVLAVPVATAAFPSMIDGGQVQRAAETVLAPALRTVLVAGSLGAAVLVAVAAPVGQFFALIDASRTSAAGSAIVAMDSALLAYAAGLVGFALIALLQRALYVRGTPWHGAAAVAAGWLVAALVPLLVVRGATGSRSTLQVLGWSSTAGMTVGALLLVVLVGRAWGWGTITAAGRTAASALVAGLVAAGVGALVASWFALGGVAQAIGAGVVAAAVAVVAYASVLLVTDPTMMRGWLRRLGRR